MDFREIAVQNRATLQEETRRILDASQGIVAVGQEIPQSLASFEPVAIEAGDGEHVRNIDLIARRLAPCLASSASKVMRSGLIVACGSLGSIAVDMPPTRYVWRWDSSRPARHECG